jgi:hypothetical protein
MALSVPLGEVSSVDLYGDDEKQCFVLHIYDFRSRPPELRGAGIQRLLFSMSS